MALQPASRPDRALEQLTRRAQHMRTLHAARRSRAANLQGLLSLGTLGRRQRELPSRFLLHAVIAALVPLTFLLSQSFPTRSLVDADGAVPLREAETDIDGAIPIGPITLQPHDDAVMELPVPDSAFAEIQALPEAQVARSRQERLAPLTLTTTVVGDQVNVRNGPGLAYDTLGTLAAGTALTLEAIAGEWFAARTPDGQRVWIAAELVADAGAGIGLLTPATDIPPPPPPKVAVVKYYGALRPNL